MSTKAPWISPPNLSRAQLSALEEKVLRMRYGWRGHDFTPVNRKGDIGHGQALEELEKIEARLRAQAGDPTRARKPRSPKD